MIKSVSILTGKKPGKTLAIFAGVHGNEKVGIETVRALKDELKIERGKVYLVLANPEAIKLNTRFVNKNLNRIFVSDNVGNSYEDKRARELMLLLDTCDALLDLHSFNSEKGSPFAICAPLSFDLAKRFDVGLISYGWNDLEPGGTEHYMDTQGKVAVCLEAGPTKDYKKYLSFAKKSVLQFLDYFDAIDADLDLKDVKKSFFKVEKVYKKNHPNFRFSRQFDDFEELKQGELIAEDGDLKYFAESRDSIVFPRDNGPVGSEAFLLGKFED